MINKAVLVVGVWVMMVVECLGQNLVPNPSFEEYTSCPNDVGLIDSAIGWTCYGNGQSWGPATPDYYNVCADTTAYPDSLVSIPYNMFGFQYPDTGKAYVGLICFATTVTDLREIIGCKLSSPLEVGLTYDVSFKANCSYGGFIGNYMASNGLGIKFTMQPYSNDNPIPIDNNPDIYSSSIISDTLNWTKIEGQFTSDSAYEYIALGNFIQDSFLDTIHLIDLGGPGFRIYYFIDDVLVIKESGDGVESLNKIKLNISPNPATTLIQLHLQSSPTILSIFNLLGQKVKEQKVTTQEVTMDVSELPAGMYVVRSHDRAIGKFVKE